MNDNDWKCMEMNEWAKKGLASERQAVWDGIQSLTRDEVYFTYCSSAGCNRGRAFGSWRQSFVRLLPTV